MLNRLRTSIIIGSISALTSLSPISHSSVITFSSETSDFRSIPECLPIEFSFNLNQIESINSHSLQVMASGDFDQASEYIEVKADDIYVGKLFDNNPENDLFKPQPYKDIGKAPLAINQAFLTLPDEVFSTLIDDGWITYQFAFSHDVSQHANEWLKVNLNINTEDKNLTPVPIPSSLSLLLIGMAAIAIKQKRKSHIST